MMDTILTAILGPNGKRPEDFLTLSVNSFHPKVMSPPFTLSLAQACDMVIPNLKEVRLSYQFAPRKRGLKIE
jgi:hypothetical protein